MDRRARHEILDRLDAETWVALAIEHLPGLRQRGAADYWALCPVHPHEGVETLHVREDRLLFKCFAPGCVAGGPIELLKQIRGLTEDEALALLAKRVGLDG